MKHFLVTFMVFFVLSSASFGIVVLNENELLGIPGWDLQFGPDTLEIWEEWIPDYPPVCVEIVNDNSASPDIVLTVTKHIHNNDASGIFKLCDFHNALLVPDPAGTGGWVPSPDNDGLFFTGPPAVPDIGPNPNASTDRGWTNEENPLNDTLDFYGPPCLEYCEWITLTFQITVPAGQVFNLDQYATWVPEPASMLMLSLGVLGLRKRR